MVIKKLVVEERDWEEEICIPKFFSTPVPYEKLRMLISHYFRAFYLHPKQLLVEFLRSAKSNFRIKIFLKNISEISNATKPIYKNNKKE
jgi:hypothetical protein